MLRPAAGMIALLFLVLTPGQAAVAQSLDPHLFNTPWAKNSSSARRSVRSRRSPAVRRAQRERRERVRRQRAGREQVRSRSSVRTASTRIGRDAERSRRSDRRSSSRQSAARQPTRPVPDVMSGGPKPRIAVKQPATVRFSGYSRGEIVIDHAGRQLFYVLGGGRAYRYPIAVGRDGFEWFGNKRITRTAKWPDWRPPAEMRERNPELPKMMTGGLHNPLGYKALYLGSSLYRIHGTPNTGSIGSASSSGCFRMHNGHVEHLSRLVSVGTRVRVLRELPSNIARSVRASLRNS